MPIETPRPDIGRMHSHHADSAATVKVADWATHVRLEHPEIGHVDSLTGMMNAHAFAHGGTVVVNEPNIVRGQQSMTTPKDSRQHEHEGAPNDQYSGSMLSLRLHLANSHYTDVSALRTNEWLALHEGLHTAAVLDNTPPLPEDYSREIDTEEVQVGDLIEMTITGRVDGLNVAAQYLTLEGELGSYSLLNHAATRIRLLERVTSLAGYTGAVAMHPNTGSLWRMDDAGEWYRIYAGNRHTDDTPNTTPDTFVLLEPAKPQNKSVGVRDNYHLLDVHPIPVEGCPSCESAGRL